MTRMKRNSTAYVLNTMMLKRNWNGAVNSMRAYLSDAPILK